MIDYRSAVKKEIDPQLEALQAIAGPDIPPDISQPQAVEGIARSVEGAVSAPVEGSISSVEGTMTPPVEGALPAQGTAKRSTMQGYVDAPTTTAAYRQLPASAAPQQVPRETSFDWGRALTALGGGDVGSYDARKRYNTEAPFREAQQRLELEQGNLRNTGTRGEQEDAAMRRNQAMAALNPQSPESQDAQNRFAAEMNATASTPGLPTAIVQEFKNAAARAAGRSAAQLSQDRETLYGLFKNVLSGVKIQDTQAKQAADEEYKAAMLNATVANNQSGRAIQVAGLNQNDAHFQAELERKRAADEARAKASRLRIQSKSVDKKAVEELQNIDGMEGMLKEAEAAIPKAYTGPGAGTAVKVADSVSALTGGTIGMPDSLKATQTLQSNIENAVADIRKGRFGSSLTTGEQKAMTEWKPGVQMSEESNRNLIAGIRKYLGYRAQQRVQQVFKETGMPIYMPPDKHLSLEDARKLKALYEGIDKYDDETAAGIEQEVNGILAPYGGQTRKGSGVTNHGASGGALKAPPGAKPGDRKRNPNDGKIYVVQPDMTMKPE